MISVLVQQCSSTSNPAARMIRAAVLNSRFKCSSGACVEIEGVLEISDFCFLEIPKNTAVVPDAAGCWLALEVVALMIRVSFDRQLPYCRECS